MARVGDPGGEPRAGGLADGVAGPPRRPALRAAAMNLTQAQRDFFGAHTYERTDAAGTFHSHWDQA